MKKKKILIALLAVTFIAAGAGGVYQYFHSNKPVSNFLQLYGNVDIRQINLAFHATGRIRNMYVQEGGTVREGQLAAEIDPSRYTAAVEMAQAQLNAHQKILARLLAGSRPEEISAARAKVQAAEAEFDEAKVNFQRVQTLIKDKSISQQQFDDAQAAFLSTRARLAEARQNFILAQKGPREEDIAAERAQLQAEEAALALAQQELRDTKLYAPAAGIIQNRILEPGDMAFPQTPVFTLALNDPIWIRAYVSETDLGKIFPGMRVEVHTDSFPDKSYRGWIGYISPTAEFTPKQIETTELRSRLVYQLRINVCNPRNELRLGMPATVIVPLEQPAATSADNAVNPCGEQ